VLERFRHGADGGTPPAAIPALDAVGTCVGLLRERDFRRYVYSPFGIALLRHAALSQPFGGLLVPVPVADIHADLRVVQDLFLGSPENEGVVVSEDGRYAGFLDARSILEAVSEKELSDARDQNPLSKLPGNPKLEEYLAARWEDPAADCLFCYFDFNDFKPFNDRYGFRRGDRVILLFADILRDIAARLGWFVAHIGGDDFFAGIDIANERTLAEAERGLDEAIERFAGSVAAFYDEPDRSRGWIEGRDRNDEVRPFPLLSVIGARYRRKPGPAEVPLEAAGELFARLKKEAKKAKTVAVPDPIALIPQLY
jgi:GGDEF domain-containing protein